MEVAVVRDMGSLFHTKIKWGIVAGMAVNDISMQTQGGVQANISKITDLYSLYGQVPPVAPYSAPSSSSSNVVDANGNAVLNSDGTNQTVTTDTTVLLGDQPADRDTSGSKTDNTSVNTLWKLHGAYYTFRAGPTVDVPITSRFKLNASLGPTLIYAGTNYTVTQTYQPETGAEITNTSTSAMSHLLPGYFADASLQFDLTERTGFYAGAVFQSAGSYTHNLNSDTAHYSSKVDFSNQQGLRAGMTYRF